MRDRFADCWPVLVLPVALLLVLFLPIDRIQGPETDRLEPSYSRVYLLATATTGGTFYPVGVALATLTRQQLEPQHGLALAAISSAGSEENLRLMRSGEAPFAILQGLYGARAWTGDGLLNEQGAMPELRSVTALWPNVEHFLIRQTLVDSGDLSDLQHLVGRRFSIGAAYSGTEGSNRHILESLGFDPDRDFSLVFQGYGASADAFQNQLIDGMNTPAGVPVGAVTRAMASGRGDAVLLSVTDQQLAAINQRYPDLWRFHDLPADSYPHQPQPVRTIAQANLLAVTADVPDEHVYRVLEVLYDQLGFLQAFHAATRSMSLDNALDGLPAPLHPGAYRFFRERGLDIPDRLRPPELDE
ncbi:MAG: TAXI family TRAP transporter solute-binding subunit [Wenzhouxiangella sp.]